MCARARPSLLRHSDAKRDTPAHEPLTVARTAHPECQSPLDGTPGSGSTSDGRGDGSTCAVHVCSAASFVPALDSGGASGFVGALGPGGGGGTSSLVGLGSGLARGAGSLSRSEAPASKSGAGLDGSGSLRLGPGALRTSTASDSVTGAIRGSGADLPAESACCALITLRVPNAAPSGIIRTVTTTKLLLQSTGAANSTHFRGKR